MFGGNSVEHEISILTALSVMEHLSAERYEAIPCYVSKQGELYHGPMLKKLSAYRNLDDLCRRLKPGACGTALWTADAGEQRQLASVCDPLRCRAAAVSRGKWRGRQRGGLLPDAAAAFL